MESNTTVIRQGTRQRPTAQADRALVPRRCTLEGFTEEVSRLAGITVTALEALTTLLISTENSIYRIIVLHGSESRVLVQGGSFFPEPTEGRISGSSFGGSLLRLAWIGIGLRMEIYAGGRHIVTSPVRTIGIQQDSALPGPF